MARVGRLQESSGQVGVNVAAEGWAGAVAVGGSMCVRLPVRRAGKRDSMVP